MRLSYLLRSHDRAEALAETLSALPKVTPLPPMLWETRVIVGASLDEMGPMLAQQFPRVHAIAQHGDDEKTAMKQALAECAGDYVIVLDPQTHPMDHRSISTALAHLDRDPSLGAVSGRFLTAGGALDEPMLPTVLVDGVTCFRRSMLAEIGPGVTDLISAGITLELSFEMWNAGFGVERCQDFVIQQNNADAVKSSDAMDDFRDCLILAKQFFPHKLAKAYWTDWRLRFSAMARYDGRRKESWRALWAARRASYRSRSQSRKPLNDDALEGMLGMRQQAIKIGNWARENSVWRVVIADFSGNVYATYNACKSCGLQIRCIADNHPAFEDVEYRGLPIAHVNKAFEGGGIEGVVVSNPFRWISQQRAQVVRRHFKGPILQISGAEEAIIMRRAAAA